MYRYSTPTIPIRVKDADLSQFSSFIVTLRQLAVKIDLTPVVNGDTLTVELTQEQTAMFTRLYPVNVQVNAFTAAGKRFPSNIMHMTIGEDEDAYYKADKSFADIVSADAAGKIVLLKSGAARYYLTEVRNGELFFTRWVRGEHPILRGVSIMQDETVSFYYYEIDCDEQEG